MAYEPWKHRLSSVRVMRLQQVKTLEGLFQEVEESEIMMGKVEERKVQMMRGTESNKVGSKVMGSKIRELVAKFSEDNGREYTTKVVKNSRGLVPNLNSDDNGGEYASKVKEYYRKLCANVDSDDNGGEYASKVRENSRKLCANVDSDDNGGGYTSKVIENSQSLAPNLGIFGSMMKEKEWKRTLACKLFEERHNVDGGEGMDLLWETYEKDSYKSKTKKERKGGIEYYEDEKVDPQCCLQALNLSAGKMNLGMGGPNLLSISKALKGIGWLHNVSKHGKKWYN